MALWRTSDSVNAFVDEVSAEIGKKGEAGKWKRVLAENLFTTCGSLCALTCEDYLALGLPLRMCEIVKKRIIASNIQNALVVQTIDINDIKPEPTPNCESFLDLTRFVRPVNQNATINTEERKQTVPKETPTVTAGRRSTFMGSVKRKSKASKSQVTGSSTIDCKVFVVGRGDHPKYLLGQCFPNQDPSTFKGYKQVLDVYGKRVKLEILDSSNSRGDLVSAAVLVFSCNSWESLQKMHQKYKQTMLKQKEISVPLLLVGLDRDDDEGHKKASKSDINTVLSEMNAIQYIKLSTEQDAKYLMKEIARIIIRNQIQFSSKIIETIQKHVAKKQAEISLKKRQLQILPNEFFTCAALLQRLRLDGNNFKYFPVEVLKCSQLLELSLNANQIESIPNSISRLTQLTRFEIEANKLEDLPCIAISEMTNLSDLKLGGNPLTKLPFKLKPKIELKQITAHAKGTLLCRSSSEEVKPEDKISEHTSRPAFPIFGVPLSKLMENEYKLFPDIPIPRIVRYSFQFILLHGLSQEGIFRLAGETAHCAQIRNEINQKTDIDFLESENPHNVSAVVKQWLRELPVPILLFENFEEIEKLIKEPIDVQLSRMYTIFTKLPKENFMVLREFFRLMYFVSLSSEVNRMTASNVTKVVGPNLVYRHPASCVDAMSDITSINNINDVLTLACQYYPEIFEHDIDHLFAHDYMQKEENPDNMLAILYRKVFIHTKTMTAVTFSSDNSLLWSADSGGICKITNCKNMSCVCKVETNRKRVNCLIRSERNIWIGLSDAIQVRDEVTGDLIKEIPEAAFSLCCTSGYIWALSNDTILVINTTTFDVQKVAVEGFPSTLANIHGKVWFICSDKQIRIFDNQTFTQTGIIDISQCGRLNSLVLIDDFVWGGSDSTIVLWDPETLELKETLATAHKGKVFGACPVGATIWTYSWDSSICIFDRKTFKQLGVLPRSHTDAVASVVTCYDDKLQCWKVISGSWDNSFVVWLARKNPNTSNSTETAVLEKQSPVSDLTSLSRQRAQTSPMKPVREDVRFGQSTSLRNVRKPHRPAPIRPNRSATLNKEP